MHHRGLRPLLQQLRQPGARAVDEHPAPHVQGLQFDVAYAVVQAIGLPLHGKGIVLAQLPEGVGIDRLVLLTARPALGRVMVRRDQWAAGGLRPGLAQALEDTVLAGPRGADDINQVMTHGCKSICSSHWKSAPGVGSTKIDRPSMQGGGKTRKRRDAASVKVSMCSADSASEGPVSDRWKRK